MSKKLYVGGLSYDTDQQTLQDLFSQAGTVDSAAVITDRETGRSRGFGFVEMSNDEEAQNAIKMFNGKELDGRSITVNEAKPQEARSNNRGFSREGRGHGGGYGRRNDW